MNAKRLAAGLACGLSLLAGGAAFADGLEDGVLAELNDARAHPQDYARRLEAAAQAPQDASDLWTPIGQDQAALEEAVAYLMRQHPLPPLTADEALAGAALDHSAEQGPSGRVGHNDGGGDAQQARLRRHGVWASMAAEDISYGYATPRTVVEQLIIDSGVPDRGHRRIIFDGTLISAGVSCGRHSVYHEMCVIDFASAGPEGSLRAGRTPPKGQAYAAASYDKAPPESRPPVAASTEDTAAEGGQPESEPPYEEPPYAEQPYAEQPYGEPPYAEPPYGGQPYATAPDAISQADWDADPDDGR
ncbi:MAG: CAP domain-containing protein [Caulobacteraceae bacterium]|nr:CAP domain-containing protein [Caulobacteraceae bacterium]